MSALVANPDPGPMTIGWYASSTFRINATYVITVMPGLNRCWRVTHRRLYAASRWRGFGWLRRLALVEV